ncbi:Disintegrin and metalloproteinase domain-containing protein 23 [Halotydeus destructor]|nr:Disintegrin and metalloproteinase domain-containing protein 23 [Halotydeus destructor]
MAKNILGENHIQPYHFSQCSVDDYNNALQNGNGICLFNKPNQLEDFRSCGNGIIEDDEECDCGSFQECTIRDPCCDPITCKLRNEAQCSTGPCCVNCKLKPQGHVCNGGQDECDLPEVCDGRHGNCPSNIHKKNGNACKNGAGFCFHGQCPTSDNQCNSVWGPGSKRSDLVCFQNFNAQGTLRGNCGLDGNGNHVKCSPENIICGSLQCQFGIKDFPKQMRKEYLRTSVHTNGIEYECNVAGGTTVDNIPDMILVQDGTKCSDNKICVNQTCVSIDLFIEPGDCPTNNNALTCSGHGVCSNINSCHCDQGWTGHDCSQKSSGIGSTSTGMTGSGRFLPKKPIVPLPADTRSIDELMSNTTKLTDYGTRKNTLSAAHLVMILVSIVGGVFIFFALLATCYRRRSLMPHKQEAKLFKKQLNKKLSQAMMTRNMDNDNDDDAVSRIITFGSMPSYREDKMQEMQSRHKDTRLNGETSSSSEDKGILKHGLGGGGLLGHPGDAHGHTKDKQRWSDMTSQSENCPESAHSMSDNNRQSDSLMDVDRSYKSLNGYHEEILEAIQASAAHGMAHDHSSLMQGRPSPGSEAKKPFATDPSVDYGTIGMLKPDALNTDSEADESVPPCGPIRIRNLEDLLRQLEQTQGGSHGGHLQSVPLTGISPSGSEEIRLSEPEADRHLYSSAPSRHGGHSSSSQGAHYRTPPGGGGSVHRPMPSRQDQHLVDQGLQYLLGHRHNHGLPPPPSSSSYVAAPLPFRSAGHHQAGGRGPPMPMDGSSTASTSTVLGGNGDDEESCSGFESNDGMSPSLVRSVSEEALPARWLARPRPRGSAGTSGAMLALHDGPSSATLASTSKAGLAVDASGLVRLPLFSTLSGHQASQIVASGSGGVALPEMATAESILAATKSYCTLPRRLLQHQQDKMDQQQLIIQEQLRQIQLLLSQQRSNSVASGLIHPSHPLPPPPSSLHHHQQQQQHQQAAASSSRKSSTSDPANLMTTSTATSNR